MSWESCNFTRTTSEAYNIYMENPKITSAYLHILEAAGIFSESNEEVSRTLFELARWTKDEYGIRRTNIGVEFTVTNECNCRCDYCFECSHDNISTKDEEDRQV